MIAPKLRMDQTKIATAARWIARAEHILVFCGSGLSAESGVPTFRGQNGLYDDAEILEYVHVDAMRERPDEALAWFEKVRQQLQAFQPNPGHHALARICRKYDCTIVTQNVDRLLETAIAQASVGSTPGPKVWHLHGSLHRARCHACGTELASMPDDLVGARCPACGGRVRPDIVLFGEALPEAPHLQAQGAAHVADLVLMLGTSGMVYPAALLPGLARSHGAQLIEVNPNPTELSNLAHLTIRGKTGEVLPAIEKLLG